MKKPFIALLLVALILFAGCSDDFLTNPLDIESGSKTRAFSITCDPPEAAPGDTVRVTLDFYDPDPGGLAISWRLAQDYTFDIYGQLETEGRVIDLATIANIPNADIDEDGIGSQSFTFVVPEDAIIASNGTADQYPLDLPEEILALFEPANEGYLTKQEVQTLFDTVDPSVLDDDALAGLRTLSDFYACQVRLRASLSNAIQLDITKNLTIRYSSRFESPNVNHNPVIESVVMIAVHGALLDVDDDLSAYEADTTYVYHSDPSMIDTSPITIDDNYSYFLSISHDKEDYHSPSGTLLTEDCNYYWYYTRLDEGAEAESFLVDEEADGHGMGGYGHLVQVMPPTNPSLHRYRMFVVVRDFRLEWRTYNGTPGARFSEFPLEIN